MSKSPKYCYSCVKSLLNIPSWYCCNPNQLSCAKCSAQICRKCKKQRSIEFKPSVGSLSKGLFPSKINRQNTCDSCGSSEAVALRKHFEEKKCKKYYCHSCVWFYYNNFTKMLQDYLRKNGEAIQMEVELQCGCEISKYQIIAYLRRYCIDCSQEITGQRIVLKNQCIIMVECIKRLERQLSHHKLNISKRNKIVQLLQSVNSLIAVCTVCDMKIDGSLRTEWEIVDNMCICSICLRLSKENQQKFYISSQKKRKQETFQKQKQYQIVEKPNLQQKKCKNCRIQLKKSDQQNDLCEACISYNSKAIKQFPNDSFHQQKLDHIQSSKLQKQNKQQQISSPLKSKINDPQFPNQSSSKKSKPQLSSPIKEHQSQQDIPDQQYSCFPSKSNIQRAAIQSENISFKLQFPQENMSQSKCCCQCKCMFEDTLITYKRQKDRQQTIRIAQLPQQVAKYTKQNRIQIYCKSCYLQLKFKIKLNKPSDVFRRGDVRRTGSMPKPPVKEVKPQSRFTYLNNYDYSPNSYKYQQKKQSGNLKFTPKIQKNNNQCSRCNSSIIDKPLNQTKTLCKACSYLQTQQNKQPKPVNLKCCSECKQFIGIQDRTVSESSLCYLCKKKKSNQLYCQKCKKLKEQSQFNKAHRICRDCQLDQIQISLKNPSSKIKMTQFKCRFCSKNVEIKQSDRGKKDMKDICIYCLMQMQTRNRGWRGK